jgi:hypothetical protein
MTEQEYLDVTNLTKVRAAKEIIRDTLFMNPTDENSYSQIMSALTNIQLRLERAVVSCTTQRGAMP